MTFQIAASRLNVHPKQCIFVDDFFENCKGAESVGMRAIQVFRFLFFPNLYTVLLSKVAVICEKGEKDTLSRNVHQEKLLSPTFHLSFPHVIGCFRKASNTTSVNAVSKKKTLC